MSKAWPRTGAHLTLYKMLVLSGIGLVVGSVSAFSTIGFVELVHWLNDFLYVNVDARSQLTPGKLAVVTIAALTLGGLLVGLILHFGVKGGSSLGPPEAILSVQLREKLPSPISGFL